MCEGGARNFEWHLLSACASLKEKHYQASGKWQCAASPNILPRALNSFHLDKLSVSNFLNTVKAMKRAKGKENHLFSGVLAETCEEGSRDWLLKIKIEQWGEVCNAAV